MTLEDFEIDYALLSKAKQYYARRGYQYVEVPWAIEPRASRLTTTDDKAFVTTQDEHLVGSAEQAFLHLAIQNEILPNAKYFAISPCFRRDTPDDSHSRWFMKLELFAYYHDGMYEFNTRLLKYMVEDAFEFFFDNIKWLRQKHLQKVVTSENSLDINYNDIEVGSYGTRKMMDFTAVYGTGLALPRFSYALSTV